MLYDISQSSLCSRTPAEPMNRKKGSLHKIREGGRQLQVPPDFGRRETRLCCGTIAVTWKNGGCLLRTYRCFLMFWQIFLHSRTPQETNRQSDVSTKYCLCTQRWHQKRNYKHKKGALVFFWSLRAQCLGLVGLQQQSGISDAQLRSLHQQTNKVVWQHISNCW